MKTLLTLVALATAAPTLAASVPLASTMNPNGTISESTLTGETFVISNGVGTVANGLAGDDDSNPAFGGAINLFPNEANFSIGALDFDTAAISAIGTSNAAVTSLDLSGLYTPDPNRVVGAAGTDASVLSDISDWAIGAAFFNFPGAITFGALDAADTVTFEDGVLTSIDIEVTADFTIGALAWSGALSIFGDQFSFQINDTIPSGQPAPFDSTTLVVDLTGTVASVGTFAIPEPATLLAVAPALAFVTARRR
ncbi:MAG: hypothetical protein AAFV43_15835 [Planctomycetota bacterium]